MANLIKLKKDISERLRRLEQDFKRKPLDSRVTLSFSGTLPVSSFVNEQILGWTTFGANPWLNTNDDWTSTIGSQYCDPSYWISYWHFENLPSEWEDTDIPTSCTLRLKVWWDSIQYPETRLNIWIYNGSWNNLGEFYPAVGNQWAWIEINVLSYLNTAAKINGARLKLRHQWNGMFNTIGLTYAELSVTISKLIGEQD